MTAIEIVKKRTGCSPEDAEFYVLMADAKVRTYLSLEDTADITPYTVQIADIAVLYFQRDTGTKQSTAILGYSSQSFSEGGVKKSVAVRTGAEMQTIYDRAVDDILLSLNGNAGTVVFL